MTVSVVQARCRAGGARQADSSDGRLHRPGSSVGREARHQSVQQEVLITGQQWSMAPYGDTENTLALPLCRARTQHKAESPRQEILHLRTGQAVSKNGKTVSKTAVIRSTGQ